MIARIGLLIICKRLLENLEHHCREKVEKDTAVFA